MNLLGNDFDIKLIDKLLEVFANKLYKRMGLPLRLASKEDREAEALDVTAQKIRLLEDTMGTGQTEFHVCGGDETKAMHLNMLELQYAESFIFDTCDCGIKHEDDWLFCPHCREIIRTDKE